MQIKSYAQAVKYLGGFIGKVIFKVDKEFLKKHDPLERMRIFLSLLGNPQEKFKSVLVGGTAGKSSTSYLISHILTTAGYKTGFTLSPHLQKVNERLQINGQSISDSQFAKLTDSMIRIIEQMKKMRIGEPSYFEILIGMAFTYFAKEKVNIAVAEVGMGGEFDATNTLNPLIAVLTNVSLDHTNVLGGTVQKIAKTKAGIIKKNKESRIRNQGGANYSSSIIHDSLFMIHFPIVITGVKQPSVIKIVEDRCRKAGAEVFRLVRDFSYKIRKEGLEGSVFDLISQRDRVKKLNDLTLSLLGKYQIENASLAIETVLQLGKFGFKVSEDDIRKALKTAFFPGRFEVLRLTSFAQNKMSATLILDGAHNPTKMKAFIYPLKKLYPNYHKIFLIAFKNDKDIPRMLKQIIKVADEIIVTEFSAKTDVSVHASAKALNLKSLIFNLKSDAKVAVEKDSKKALKIGLKAIQQYNNSAILVVTGSLYLVGEIRNKIALF